MARHLHAPRSSVRIGRWLAAIALLPGLLGSLSAPAWAETGIDAISLSGGNGSNSLNALRAGVQWHWSDALWEGQSARLVGYWDLSVAIWHNDPPQRSTLDDGAETIAAVALAPVFRLESKPLGRLRVAPFIELAVGAAVLSDRELRSGDRRSRNLGSYWQFEDRGVLGARFGARQAFELAYQRMHYSNLGLASSNTGIDAHLLMLRWRLNP